MSLESLTIQQFRNIESAELIFDRGINLIFGENGSGKTSILEAIQYLSSGKSFRTRNLAPLIKQGSEALTIAANVSEDANSHRIGIRRSPSRLIRRIDNISTNSQVEFSRLLPVRTLHPDSHLLISSGPGLRRRYMDWGCFYFDEHFYTSWHSAHTLLKQRNAALKDDPGSKLLFAIDQELIPHSENIHRIRKQYLDLLLPEAHQIGQGLIKEFKSLDIRYEPGWSINEDLFTALKKAMDKDRRYKRTHYGTHRADFTVTLNGRDARSTASRGQQKLIAFVLVLAQLAVYQDKLHQNALLMVDDLASELDMEHQKAFLSFIHDLDHQVILTAISEDLINLSGMKRKGKMFHVKHGQIQEVI
jgi:DNA replication and repair protein RecF